MSPSRHAFAWTFHNLVGHPASELVYLVAQIPGVPEAMRLRQLSDWIHDATAPGRHRTKSPLEIEVDQLREDNRLLREHNRELLAEKEELLYALCLQKPLGRQERE